MADLQRQMASLGRFISDLEQKLGELSAELAELTYVMNPFLVRYQIEVLQHHDELITLQRDIADMQALRGSNYARDPGQADTPLGRLVDTVGFKSVQDQYDSIWGENKGKRPPTISDLIEQELEPASDELREAYSAIAANLHPGLVETAEERMRRHVMMHKVNQAYVKRNLIGLRGVADTYKNSSNLPAVVNEEIIREREQLMMLLERAIVRLEGQIFELRHGDIAKLRIFAEQATQQGKDLLADLGAETRRELEQAKRTLSDLQYNS